MRGFNFFDNEEMKRAIIADFTKDYLNEVKKMVKKHGKETIEEIIHYEH